MVMERTFQGNFCLHHPTHVLIIFNFFKANGVLDENTLLHVIRDDHYYFSLPVPTHNRCRPSHSVVIKAFVPLMPSG